MEGRGAMGAISTSGLEFDLPYLDEPSFRDILRYADYVGYDPSSKRTRYRLSLAKCAALGPEDLGRLGRYGVDLSEELLLEIARLREAKVVNVALSAERKV